MRVVIDTNVFISAALKEKSPPSTAIHLVIENHTFLKSAATEKELLTTLSQPKLAPLIPQRFREWLAQILAASILIDTNERITACRDPKDDKFLELAVNGHSDLIISGDNDLLVLDPFQGIPILTPAAFVQGTAK